MYKGKVNMLNQYEPKPHLHWVRIKVTPEFKYGEVIEEILWMDLRTEIKMKYNWYFKYRAALLQVKYPKYYVELEHAIYPASTKNEQLKFILQNKLKATERKISQHKNHIKKVIKEWLSLIPYTEDYGYKIMVEKIKGLEQRKEYLLKEIEREG